MLTVYHGSTCPVKQPLAGVCRPNLDFGVGFYVTDVRRQAERWALRVADTRNKGEAWLSIYELDKEAICAKYRYLHFAAYDGAWLDFVVACRRGNNMWQDYDVIEGGIADDRVVRTIDLYLRGDYTRDEALARLIHQEPNNQICLVNQEVIDCYLCLKETVSLSIESEIQNTVSNQYQQSADPVMQTKYLGIIESLTKLLHISPEQALDIFYSSDTYRDLSHYKGDLYIMSIDYLTNKVIEELRDKQG